MRSANWTSLPAWMWKSNCSEESNSPLCCEATADAMVGLIGKKLGMTQVFDEKGELISVTVIQAGPCTVVQAKTAASDGYAAVQLGFGDKKAQRASRAYRNHCLKAASGR
jgi:hypothetical protein